MGILRVEGGAERGQHDHKKILEDLEHRDPVGAQEAMKAHLKHGKEDARKAPSE